ncbi:hypothetical protein [Prolixibacter denitrificans]|uniref:Uncharacterized protein n=1 Tax=Prolixibacter denitrificans TaxID=1541063 RepID=A0A2P8CE11_9BACT|nr:hypothetical protein [Prolixibacter denitrificans]PSK83152.1 hypothetical protein CLV93_10482 [Prolixibacter denitrificans]GET21965.1 hypothetical protein JCM18694_22110 [Prolixibacter denitrificans]
MKKEILQFGKQFLLTALIMSLCLLLFDLWDPIKQMITGHFDSEKDLTSYISLKTDIPVIVAVSIVMARASMRRKKATKN